MKVKYALALPFLFVVSQVLGAANPPPPPGPRVAITGMKSVQTVPANWGPVTVRSFPLGAWGGLRPISPTQMTGTGSFNFYLTYDASSSSLSVRIPTSSQVYVEFKDKIFSPPVDVISPDFIAHYSGPLKITQEFRFADGSRKTVVQDILGKIKFRFTVEDVQPVFLYAEVDSITLNSDQGIMPGFRHNIEFNVRLIE